MDPRKLTLAGVIFALVVGPGPALGATTSHYVGLGDSYTSGPLIPNPKGSPPDCGRSDHNYPTLVANAIAPSRFIDVSCGSAQTKHMTQPQTGLPAGGTNPAQFNALDRAADLVTIGIGGNDMGFGDIVQTCAELGLQSAGLGAPCTNRYNAGGNDQIAQRLREVVAPRLASVIAGIQQRSPQARLLVVGYPDPVPQSPGCYPVVPIAPGDLPYLHRVAAGLSATVESEANLGGAEFVDLRPGSLGHDICQPPGPKWYEGIAPTSPAYPAHPNVLGMEFAAREVLRVLGRPVPNDFKVLKRRGRRGGSIRLLLEAPFRGWFRVRAITKRDGKRIAYPGAEQLAERAGRLKIRLRPTRAVRRALKANGRLRVRLNVAFSPVGGTTKQKQRRVRVGPRRNPPSAR